MSIGVYVREDVRANVLAGVVLTITTAQSQGAGDIGYIAGALAMARYTALAFCLDWSEIVACAKRLVGDDLGGLLDAATVRILEG